MLHELFITHCTNCTSVMNPFTESFLGMLRFIQSYILNMSPPVALLKELLKANQSFYWKDKTNTGISEAKNTCF